MARSAGKAEVGRTVLDVTAPTFATFTEDSGLGVDAPLAMALTDLGETLGADSLIRYSGILHRVNAYRKSHFQVLFGPGRSSHWRVPYEVKR